MLQSCRDIATMTGDYADTVPTEKPNDFHDAPRQDHDIFVSFAPFCLRHCGTIRGLLNLACALHSVALCPVLGSTVPSGTHWPTCAVMQTACQISGTIVASAYQDLCQEIVSRETLVTLGTIRANSKAMPIKTWHGSCYSKSRANVPFCHTATFCHVTTCHTRERAGNQKIFAFSHRFIKQTFGRNFFYP